MSQETSSNKDDLALALERIKEVSRQIEALKQEADALVIEAKKIELDQQLTSS